MIDSGSQSSLVSEGFVLKHQLTCAPLRPAIPIQGLDGEPLSKGSISHVVVLNVKLGDHSEFKTFGIVKMPWDLLLGIDWLQKHNPVINWKSGSIHFLAATQVAWVLWLMFLASWILILSATLVTWVLITQLKFLAHQFLHPLTLRCSQLVISSG